MRVESGLIDIAYATRYTRHELARIRPPTSADARVRIRSMTRSWSAAERAAGERP